MATLSKEIDLITITLELSADQEQRLEDGKPRRDASAVRAVLLQAADSAILVLLDSRSALPSLAEFTALLDELEVGFRMIGNRAYVGFPACNAWLIGGPLLLARPGWASRKLPPKWERVWLL
jgi:hypothetical protein